ncbi:MAG: DUF4957 domain-containing protein [Bacteroidales bacterium]|nr:DUF4957 domain-containing protein [Bacteroidales bacterium]
MKRILSIMAMAFALVVSAVSCADDIPELQEEIALTRCLVPTELSAKISNGQDVQFNWVKAKGATLFVLELYNDEAMTDLFESFNIAPEDLPFKISLEADKTFYARVKAVDENGVLQDSKWAEFEDPIQTTAVKPNMFLEFTAKTSESVTVTWEATDSELERIEWAAGEAVEKRDLTAEEIAAGQATVTGLKPATSYSVSIWFKSANRGEVVALTDPDLEGFVEVADVAALKSALAAKQPKIYVTAAGSPYELGVVDLLAGVEMVGEQGVDGSRPVIYGEFHVADGYDGKAVKFETVEFNGKDEAYGFPFQLKNGGAENKTFESILFKNCNITAYSKGLIYEWGKTLTTARLAWDGCVIWNVNKSFENGGDGIDFRGASDVKSFEVINNTVYNGFRTFLRLDAALIVGDLKIENNTFMNISYNAGNANGNNSGIMGIKCKPATATFKHNLVMNMPDGCGLSRKASANLTPSELGMVYSNNHFYNVGEKFFSDGDAADQNNKVSKAEALAGGGSILSADPCYNAKGGVFNLTNSELISAKVGAPQWQVIFVEKAEDLTLACLEGAHTWDFTDARYFTGTVEKHMVRDYLYMGAGDVKLAVDGGVINFSAATVTKKNVPLDGYVAFKVDKPGSVYINAVDPEGLGNHLVVAVGPVDGSSATIKGGAVANTHNTTNQKILISDITEESLVYVYASGPIGLSALAWALDLSQVNTALDTPAPTIEPAKVDQGAASDVTVTWEPVENAGSYSVVFSGKTYTVEDATSYTISANVVKFLDAGSYKVEIYANPAEGDIYNTQSSAGVAVLTVAAKSTGGSTEFIVSSVEDLMNAIASGKEDITLAYSSAPYEIGNVTLTTPLRLTGQISDGAYTPISGSFKLSGNVKAFILRNLDIDATNAEGAVIIDDKEAEKDENGYQVVADTVAIYDSYIHDGAPRLYDNSGKAASCVQNVIFSGIHVDNYSKGNDMIDFRAGHYHRVTIVNSTFSNSARTFMRTDAGSEINYLTVRNNTFYKVATNTESKDNNGLFHVRGTAGSGMIDYRVMNNLFYSILMDTPPTDSKENGYPKFVTTGGLKPNVIANNYFYNIEEREDNKYKWWTSKCTREEGIAGGGAVLPADPCKDAANGDYTLINAVAMNANIGDPRWNPMRGSNPTSEIAVENVSDLLTAISAGKKTVTLKAGTYDLTAVTDVADVSNGKLTIVNPLNLIGEEGAVLVGSFVLSGEKVTVFTINGLEIEGIGDYLITMADNAVAGSISLKNTSVVKTGGLIYGAKNKGASLNTLELSGCHFDEIGTKDFIDFRDGTTLNAVRVVNNTFANGIRTFARVDAACVCSSINVQNNTFYNLCFTDSKDNNGIFHVRATSMSSATFKVSRNIFASMNRAEDAPTQANGYPKLVSTNSANIIPAFSQNYYYDVQADETADFCFWTKGRITQDDAVAGYGVILSEDPFKAAADGDFTLVNALAISERIGDQCWNPNSSVRPDDWFTVNNVDELLTAISAGKQNVQLAYGTYDLTDEALVNDAVSNGKLTVVSSLNIKGKERDGLKPEFIGGFELDGTDLAFSATGVLFNGDNTVDNFVHVAEDATVTNITFRNCEVAAYKNRMIYQDKETSVTSAVNIIGNLVYDMGTSGDFIDVRKGTLKLLNVKNNTFYNGIRTFVRMDAAVVCGAVTVENNTFYNLCYADNKDNNGIFHVRSSSLAVASYVVRNNLFASMHKVDGAPTDANANGFPKLLSTNKDSKVPSFSSNFFYDVDTADAATSWFTPGKRADMAEADVLAAATADGGAVLTESPFTNENPGESGKFNVTVTYNGVGDPRW